MNFLGPMRIILLILIIQNIFAITPSSIPLEFREENNFYTVPIKIGLTDQEFEVQVDTTTSEIWVPSLNTSYNVVKYNPKQSNTSNVTERNFEIDDEDGNVKGIAAYDTIIVGNYKIDTMGFVLVDQFQHGFKDFKQGKLGLGFRHEHGVDFNWIGYLKKEGLIQKEMFTIDPEENELIVGGIPSAYEGETYTYCDLAETYDLDDVYRAGWVCELTHMFLGVDTDEKNLEMAIEVDARVIFDSGFNYISMPRRHLREFKEKFMEVFFNDSCIEVKENDEIYFVCDDDDKISSTSIAFVIGGYGYVIPWEKLFKKIEYDKYELLVRFPRENDDIFSFGYPFLSEYATVYNAEEKRVGFFGGVKIDVSKDWDIYMSGESPAQKKEKMKKVLTYGGIFGGILLFIVICLIIRSCKKPATTNRSPIINQENAL